MSDELKLCMIGAGSHSRGNIYPYFHFLKDARVVANCDLDVDRARQLGSKFGITRHYGDYRRMLEEERPDGVMVCVNSTFHAQVAAELLEKGFHVYTEKPNANTLAECRRVLAASRAAGRVCMVGYKKRFAPAYAKARQIIEGEEFGQPVLMNLLRTRWPHERKDDPRTEYMLQWGCHAIDLLTFMFGPIATVAALTAGPSPWAYAIAIRYANGAVGTFTVSERIKGRNLEELTAIGSNGTCVKVDNSIEMWATKHNVPFAHHKGDFVNGSAQGGVEQGFVGELQAFVDAIRSGQAPHANIEQATHTMAVYEAMQKSATADGAMVEVEAI